METAEIIAEQATESKTQVRRYIRLTNLIPELLDMMDEGKIALSVGVELSFLDDELQYDVLNACEENDNTPSYAQAVEMRKLYKIGELDCDYVYEIMSREKAKKMIVNSMIRQIKVFRDYKLEIEFNFDIKQFFLGIDTDAVFDLST